MPQKCHVINCNKEVVAKNLCQMHYMRLKRHGHIDQTRSSDWGKREKHPAYKSWCGLVRYHRHAIPEAWLKDFWAFVKDIPEKPSSEAKIHRPNPDLDWSSSNFYWKEPRFDKDIRADRAKYMREWQRAARAADPDYGKNSDLKKNYGVTLAWYKEQYAKQDGVCAICNKPETAVIRGKQVSLAVDHCHDTGTVRGLLCMSCNRAIGMLKHSRDLFQKAIAYLDAYV